MLVVLNFQAIVTQIEILKKNKSRQMLWLKLVKPSILIVIFKSSKNAIPSLNLIFLIFLIWTLSNRRRRKARTAIAEDPYP